MSGGMAPGRILVTGASGFVGRHLMPRLAAAFPGAKVAASWVELTDATAVAAAVADLRPDACIHLAGITSVPGARQAPERAWAVNLHGTLNLAHALLREAPACTLLFASSADAYGASFRTGQALCERAALAPLNDYGATKAAADLALGALAASRGLRVIRVRPFNHTGCGQSADFALPSFARQLGRIAARLQDPVLQVGSLEAARDFLDVRDVCAGYLACLERRSAIPPGTIINLASGRARRMQDILDRMIALSGVSLRVEQDPARMRPSDIPTATGDARLARAMLGWAPVVPWEDTLATVLQDWAAQASAEAAVQPAHPPASAAGVAAPASNVDKKKEPGYP